MTDETRLCPDCSVAYAAEDNYCRQCGMYVAALRTVPVTAPPAVRAVETVRPGLPAPVKKAATAIAVGTALQVGVGLAGRYVARQAAKQAIGAVAKPGRRERRAEAKPAVVEDPNDGAASLSEMLLIRRVWLRRD